MLSKSLLALVAATTAVAWPTVSPHANIVREADAVADEYDYVIVGGGTSGLTVGDRITEGGKYSVLVIENGEYHEETGFDMARTYNIMSEPSPELNDRSFFVGLGNGVGGSSLVFGQVYLRGTSDEYAGWATLTGNSETTWNWEGLLPYFKKVSALRTRTRSHRSPLTGSSFRPSPSTLPRMSRSRPATSSSTRATGARTPASTPPLAPATSPSTSVSIAFSEPGSSDSS